MTSRRMTHLRVWLATAALTVTPIAFLATPASAGGGTGITATSAKTVIFDGGNTSAQFVRAASGIINETNRVGLTGTSQNPWSSFEVSLQFRPLTGPTGTGSPTPNPACESPTVVPPFTWSNALGNSLSGTAASGYFIGTNAYNVCVNYTHSFTLTLLANGATSTSVNVGDPVIYTGKYTYGTMPVSGSPINLAVWSGFGCTGTPVYPTNSAGLTDASGNYSFNGGPSPQGLWSVMANTVSPANQSNCVNIAVHNYGLTLLANGATSTSVNVGDPVIYTGTYTDGATPMVGSAMNLAVWSGFGCTGTPVYPTNSAGLTDASGNYSFNGGPSPQGLWSVMANTVSPANQSNCVNIAVGDNFAMTLLANGVTNLSVPTLTDITYSGTLTDNLIGIGSASVSVNIYSSPGCTNLYFAEGVVATTDGSGNFVWGPNSNTMSGPLGTFYLMASSGAQQSNCITVTVTSS